MKYSDISEESLKIAVGRDYFNSFITDVLGRIDFVIKDPQIGLFGGTTHLLWAEAKTGVWDIPEMLIQLILTIGKEKPYEKTLPPAFLGAFDYEKIAFIEYMSVEDFLYENDFNWNVAPSDHGTKEFKMLYKRIEGLLRRKTYVFYYEKDDFRLRDFIKNIVGQSRSTSKIRINKNNFLPIYLRWLEVVKPIIDGNWDELKKDNILDSDFFLADLFVEDHNTITITDDTCIKNDLFVTFENGIYKIEKSKRDKPYDAAINIKDKRLYELFWKSYKRPPAKNYQEYIVLRRDLIVPQDIRERKGAFFTPRIWVEKSQEYMAEYFGDNYQDDYYIWDCAAGTGNLLAGLTNIYNIFASTLDPADVNAMKEMINSESKTINLLESHVFQFDFLNDDFSKLPKDLSDIINDENERKKLIIYINPPYAEAATSKTVTGTGKNKGGTSIENKIWTKYKDLIGNASNELYAQFLIRIYKEIPGCKIANFSTLKILQGANFFDFRQCFRPKLERLFIVPGDTFDNVNGDFPIGFFIWNPEIEQSFKGITADIYVPNNDNFSSDYRGLKIIHSYDDAKGLIGKRYSQFYDKEGEEIGVMNTRGHDFQNQNYIRITTENNHNHTNIITKKNLIESCIYFSARRSIRANWENDRDQFLRPNDGWIDDEEFQNDCLIFTLFHNQNYIISKDGINHWIPFSEIEVNSRERFSSHFMKDFLKDRKLSSESAKVYEIGKLLWKYYHETCKENYNANASLYEIKEYFQGRDENGRLKIKSEDSDYNRLMFALKEALTQLKLKIVDKIYEYEILYRNN